MCNYFAEVEKVRDCKQKSKFGRIYGGVDISFLGAEVWTTFPGLVRGKQSARLSARRNSPLVACLYLNGKGVAFRAVAPFPKKTCLFGGPTSEARTHFNTRCIKIENRKRNQTLSIRLTQAEKSAICKKSKKAHLTLTEYILKSSLQTEIKVVDLQPLLVELKRIGNNLNQITKKINSGAFNSYNFSEMIAMQRKIYDAIIKLSREK